MKFMKLGSKPDGFQTDEKNNVRSVASDLATDVILYVGDVKFHLHKFPLLSKSYRLQKLILEASEDGMDEVYIDEFPGGPKALEICAKFCYGMTVTLNAYNVAAARCAAEYLEMIEDIEKGNLIYKIEVFLNSSIFRSWKDSIIVLQSTMSLLPWSEELKIIARCMDSIASKTLVDPSLVNWSYSYSKRLVASDQIVELYQQKVPKDWWIEDLCELEVNLYKRVMVAIKSKGRMSSELIREALKAYAMRWLPDSNDTLISGDYMKRNKSLVETLIWLLPTDKDTSGCSCRFLLKLLKIIILVEGGDSLKEELMSRISSQLHKASVKDLLFPAKAQGGTVYDIDLVKSLISRFIKQEGNDIVQSEEHTGEFVLGNTSLMCLGKLVDGYLAEIASDLNLGMTSFIDLSMMVPQVARPVHDGLYTAIDIYLKEHPNLTKAEKKKICSLMDIKTLSPEASIHAAQNERLPLRVVIQVLFFEQLRANMNSISMHGSARANIEDEDWERPVPDLKKQLKSVKKDNTNLKSNIKNKEGGGGLLLTSRSRKIFDKLWSVKGENRSSEEISGSSQSPPSSSANPGEASKSSGSSSRNRRHSVS